MSTARLAPLQYPKLFRCIGPSCEDTCCKDWGILVDPATEQKYRSLSAGPLRTLILDNLDGTASADLRFRLDQDRNCPLLSSDRLCRIQSECGGDYLSRTCARYPRIGASIGGVEETALALSCPEAARQVLLNPGLLASVESCRPESGPAMQTGSRLDHYWLIRATVLALIGNRNYPLPQRLFLLWILCRRLDSIARGELGRTVPEFLRDFEATAASGSLRPALETLPADPRSQLDVVLRLAGMLLNRSIITRRFSECIAAFTSGIGNRPNATLESLTANYSLAHDRYYAPFFSRYPYILENYLANTIVRCRFPFGSKFVHSGGRDDQPLSMSREFVSLAAQFTLTKGLLIGVAGFHRENFGAAHVVHAVQAASRHFDHHLDFVRLAWELLAESGMDGSRGLAILLQNRTAPAAPIHEVVTDRPATNRLNRQKAG